MAKRPKYHINYEMLYGNRYYRKETVVRLLKSYYRLYSLATLNHNYVALDIWIDLNTAIMHPKVLTDRQRQCIVGVYLYGYMEWEIGNAIGTSRQAVNDALKKGIRNLQRAFFTGKLYKNDKRLAFYPSKLRI